MSAFGSNISPTLLVPFGNNKVYTVLSYSLNATVYQGPSYANTTSNFLNATIDTGQKDAQGNNITKPASQELLDIINSTNPEWVKEYLFHNFWNNTYLNLSVYSEVEHERHQYEMERGF